MHTWYYKILRNTVETKTRGYLRKTIDKCKLNSKLMWKELKTLKGSKRSEINNDTIR